MIPQIFTRARIRQTSWFLSAVALMANGDLDAAVKGAQVYRLPDGPNGLKTIQNWYSVGSDPSGTIYVTASDHKTNSAMFRLQPGATAVEYVGDAKSASQAAGNLQSGETFEKFHVRPTWINGKVYVASMDYSDYDAGYLNRRGFHWYVYDPTNGAFTDLSASEPGGVAAGKLQCEFIHADPNGNWIWAEGVPTGRLLRYDIAQGKTTDLGRPASITDQYVETGSYIWTGSDSKVYISFRNSTTYDNIYYYDATTGSFGEKQDWKLVEGYPPKVGQYSNDGKRVYMASNRGHIYRYNDADKSFTYLGKAKLSNTSGTFVTRTFFLGRDEKEIFLVNDDYGTSTRPFAIYTFDIATGTTRKIINVEDIDPMLRHNDFIYHGGHDAWRGNSFFFATFSWGGAPGNLVLTGFDPYAYENRGTTNLSRDDSAAKRGAKFSKTTSIVNLNSHLSKEGANALGRKVALPAGAGIMVPSNIHQHNESAKE